MMRLAVVVASVVALGSILAGTVTAATVDFAGISWDVRSGGGGPFGTGLWSDDPDSVCVDSGGALHLRLRNQSSQWFQAEVEARTVARRGEYRFVVQAGPSVDVVASPRLEDWDVEAHNAVLGLFLYRHHGSDGSSGCPWVPGEDSYTCEIDIEVTDAWSGAICDDGSTAPGGASLFFSSQPDCDRCGPVPPMSGDFSTHVLSWQGTAIDFTSFDGQPCHEPCPVLLTLSLPVAIPEADLRPIINLWVAGGGDTSGLGHDVEVVISAVELPMLFADGFENGAPCWWSATQPPSGCPVLAAGTLCGAASIR